STYASGLTRVYIYVYNILGVPCHDEASTKIICRKGLKTAKKRALCSLRQNIRQKYWVLKKML
ncbi:hypothetical protein, partial [Duncaniella freteri]|uniref:hypothetical protein n=1 Tax=Duncaniella freteri TaxID=2530391 RepID=UPI002573C826